MGARIEQAGSFIMWDEGKVCAVTKSLPPQGKEGAHAVRGLTG